MIPSFKEYFYPFMLFLKDGELHKITDIRNYIANFFELSEKDLKEQTKGGNLRHNDRVAWTASYLKKMNLILLIPNKGYMITSDGENLFYKHGKEFSLNIVRDLDGFHKTQKKSGESKGFWIPGHYTATGKYVPGYVSQWENKGRQRHFSTKEEADAYIQSKIKNKKKRQ